jgi:hypothetical protein
MIQVSRPFNTLSGSREGAPRGPAAPAEANAAAVAEDLESNPSCTKG